MNMGFTLEGYLEGRKLFATCTGKIEDYYAFRAFKRDLFELAHTNDVEHMREPKFDELEVKFVDSYPLPNCVVGFFLKLADRDKIIVNLITNENKMLSFFIALFLDEKLNVKLFL